MSYTNHGPGRGRPPAGNEGSPAPPGAAGPQHGSRTPYAGPYAQQAGQHPQAGQNPQAGQYPYVGQQPGSQPAPGQGGPVHPGPGGVTPGGYPTFAPHPAQAHGGAPGPVWGETAASPHTGQAGRSEEDPGANTAMFQKFVDEAGPADGGSGRSAVIAVVIAALVAAAALVVFLVIR